MIFRCVHCYWDDYSAEDLDLEVLIQWGMYGRISLTGGEPFFSENIHPMLEYLDGNE